MNAAQSKLLAWGTAGVLGLGLTAYVGWFVSRLTEIQQGVTKQRMQDVLDSVEEIVQKADDIVPYSKVEAAVISLDWTGRPPARAPEVATDTQPTTPTTVPVKDLVKVLSLFYDEQAPADSLCVIRYTDAAQVRSPQREAGVNPGWIKHPGDALDPPLQGIHVASIGADGVEFAFSDESREHETVAPGEYDLQGVTVLSSEDQVQLPPDRLSIPSRLMSEPTAKTIALGADTYQLGYEDVQYIGDNYAEILSTDVRPIDHRDPRTGRRDGIQVMNVQPGSLAANHGLSTGDVVKSINGHPVTSKQEAITFVKNHANEYDKWEVVVESKGQLKTLVYYSPKK